MSARTDAVALPGGPRVLVEAIPRVGLLRDAVLVLGFAVLIGVSAQAVVPLPFTPVPITGQTFAVLFGAVALGRNRAFSGSALYLGAGMAGVPWFSPAVSATFGYVIGFVLAAAVVGAIADRGRARRPLSVAATMVLGNLVIYTAGVSYLAVATGMGAQRALALGLVPFVPGDAIKIALATALVPAAWRVVGPRTRD